jgi:hypothetical protein
MAKSDSRIMLRVEKGALVPADQYAVARLRAKGYAVGDHLLADLRKARNPGYWRLAHSLGLLLIRNVPEFEHYTDAHQVIKRLQLESGVACDSIAIKGDFGMLEHRVPRSMSFANMDEGEWRETFGGLCNWVRRRYWPELSADQIEQMAEFMPEEA